MSTIYISNSFIPLFWYFCTNGREKKKRDASLRHHAKLLNCDNFADFRYTGGAIHGYGEAVALYVHREYLAAKASIFYPHFISRAVCHGGDIYLAAKAGSDAEYVVEYHLCTGYGADVTLQRSVLTVHHHIGSTGVSHIWKSGAPPEDSIENIAGESIVARLVKLGTDLVCKVGANTAATVVDIVLVVGNILL